MDFGSWENGFMGKVGRIGVGVVSISTKEVIKSEVKLVILHNKTSIPLNIKKRTKSIKFLTSYYIQYL